MSLKPPAIRVESGTRLVVETEDAHRGSIRTENDIYPTIASVFERLGGANPVTGPIYVEGVEPGDCVALTIEDIVPGPVQGQGYTVLSQGLGGLVSSYTLQEGLEPTTVICPIKDGKVPIDEKTKPLLEIIAKYTNLPVDQVVGNCAYIDPDGKLDVKNVANQISWLREQGFVDKGFDAESIIAKEYVKPD